MLPAGRVLCFGRDTRLLQTRRLILEKRFEVSIASTIKEFAAVPEIRSFDLVVFCHTLSDEERSQSSVMVESRWPRARILVLTSDHQELGAPVYGQSMSGLDGPRSLLHKATHMLRPALAGHASDVRGTSREPQEANPGLRRAR